MPPVVIQNHSVIFPHCQKPPTQCLKWKRKIASGTRTSTNGASFANTKAADYLCRADGYLIVNSKFLNYSKLHEHPEGCCYHGIRIKGEIIKVDIIYTKLWHQRDVCCLKLHREKEKRIRHNSAMFLLSFEMKHTLDLHITCVAAITLWSKSGEKLTFEIIFCLCWIEANKYFNCIKFHSFKMLNNFFVVIVILFQH